MEKLLLLQEERQVKITNRTLKKYILIVTWSGTHVIYDIFSHPRMSEAKKTLVLGLGFETALALASKGCHVIIADVAKGPEAAEKIKQRTQNPHITSN